MADLADERTKLQSQMTRNDQLAEIVESSDDAIITTTLDGVVTSWNRGAEILYGYSAEEMMGQSARCLLPEDRPTEITEILDQVRRDGRVGTIRDRSGCSGRCTPRGLASRLPQCGTLTASRSADVRLPATLASSSGWSRRSAR